MTWTDNGKAFIILDMDKLEVCLEKYFRSAKPKSFIRQLYLYKFRLDSIGEAKKYYHPNFKRGAYHKLVHMSRISNKRTVRAVDETNELIIANDLQYQEYREMQQSATQLREEICTTVSANIKMLNELAKFSTDFISRIKEMILHFTLTTLFSDEQAKRDELELLMESKYITKKDIKKFESNDRTVSLTSTQLKRYSENNLMSSVVKKSDNDELLRISINSLNRAYFEFDDDIFYKMVINHVLDNKDVPQLTQHAAYNHLAERKAKFEMMMSQILQKFCAFTVFEGTKKHSTENPLAYASTRSQIGDSWEDDGCSVVSLGDVLNLDVTVQTPQFQCDLWE